LPDHAGRQAGQIPGAVDQHLRLISEALDLIVDLIQRPRGGKDILAVVRRIEHDDLGAKPLRPTDRQNK